MVTGLATIGMPVAWVERFLTGLVDGQSDPADAAGLTGCPPVRGCGSRSEVLMTRSPGLEAGGDALAFGLAWAHGERWFCRARHGDELGDEPGAPLGFPLPREFEGDAHDGGPPATGMP
jgi:hypothetical protein